MHTTASFSVPVVDIGPSVAAGRPVGDVAAEVDRACREVGFLAVVGHGIPEAQREDLLRQARRFFALPDADKRALAIENSRHAVGYGAIAAEQLQPDLPGDLKETFDVGIERDPDVSPLDGPNQWPTLDGFRDGLEQYMSRAIDVARLLMRIVAEANELPFDHFDACLAEPLVTLRLLRYPQAQERSAADQPGCGAHSDYGCLTLLYCDGTPGLQLLTASDQWVDVTVPEGALIVNLGDLLQRWTNDRYRSTRHRVISPVGGERYSVPMFVNPRYDTEVRCLPSAVSAERPARYEPVVSGHYLRSRYDDTYVYRQPAPT